jgi:hypothetical protein
VIYFIQDGGSTNIKIGYTGREAETRKQDGETWCPFGLTLLATMDGDKKLEGELHQRFADARINGGREWFRPVPALLQYIISVNKQAENRSPQQAPTSPQEHDAEVAELFREYCCHMPEWIWRHSLAELYHKYGANGSNDYHGLPCLVYRALVRANRHAKSERQDHALSDDRLDEEICNARKAYLRKPDKNEIFEFDKLKGLHFDKKDPDDPRDFEHGKHLSHFWYDGRNRSLLAVFSHTTPDFEVIIRITRKEVRAMINSLERDKGDPDFQHPLRRLKEGDLAAWWGNGDDKRPPLNICHYKPHSDPAKSFCVILPHEVGLEFLAVLKSRLSQMAAPDFLGII